VESHTRFARVGTWSQEVELLEFCSSIVLGSFVCLNTLRQNVQWVVVLNFRVLGLVLAEF